MTSYCPIFMHFPFVSESRGSQNSHILSMTRRAFSGTHRIPFLLPHGNFHAHWITLGRVFFVWFVCGFSRGGHAFGGVEDWAPRSYYACLDLWVGWQKGCGHAQAYSIAVRQSPAGVVCRGVLCGRNLYLRRTVP